MAPKNPKMEIVHGKTKYRVFQKVTGLVGRTESGEDIEHIIFGPDKEGVADVVIVTSRDLTEEEVALRVRWFLEANPKPRCVKCGAGYHKNYIRVAAVRGIYYRDIICDKCEPRITWVHSIVSGRS